jgi:hypothetical protein
MFLRKKQKLERKDKHMPHPPKSYEIVWKDMVGPGRLQMTI